MSRKRSSSDAALEALRRAREEPDSPASRERIREALGHQNWLVVSEAANLVAERSLDGCADALGRVWARFVENGAKTDPGCRAKEAALTALDRLEIFDPEPFLCAVRHRQFERAAGGAVDTAGGVRLRALFALFRLNHPDAPLYAGELLSDASASVRAGVCHAIAHYGSRSSAGLLVHKLASGDDDPSVLAECAAALLSAAADFAIPVLRAWLEGFDEVQQECAALAFGQSRQREAVDALIGWVEQAVLEAQIEVGVRALGVSRTERAREYLLTLVESGSLLRARHAVEALAIHRYDPELCARVREAAKKNRAARLEPLLTRLLG